MGDSMRLLIAITCVVILATVGYFGWGEWSRTQAASVQAEWQRERDSCLLSLERRTVSADAKKLAEFCVKLGHLTSDDLAR